MSIRPLRSIHAVQALAATLGLVAIAPPLSAQAPYGFPDPELTSFQRPQSTRQARDPKTPPPFTVEFMFGGGNFEHKTSGTNLDGDTDAGLFRFRFEGYGSSGFGGGLEIEAISTDDDLFAANGFGNSKARSGEIFGYGSYRIHDDRFTMPLRFGLFGRSYEIEDQGTNSELEFTSIGIKVQAEPDFAFVTRERLRFSAFGNVSLGFGTTEAETNLTSTTWDTSTMTLGIEAGLRLRLSNVTMALAYVHRKEEIDQSDVENGTFIRAMDTRFDGVAFTVGFVF